jgi:hypothetical protein
MRKKLMSSCMCRSEGQSTKSGGGGDAGTYAPAPTERVHTVMAWIHETLIERIGAGGVKVAPPIQSRIHHALSDSLTGFEHCKCAPSHTLADVYQTADQNFPKGSVLSPLSVRLLRIHACWCKKLANQV